MIAGTVFQDSHLPLTIWFRAIWQITSQKNGISALGLQRVLGLGSYKTAWAMLHKLRRAMVRPGRDQLAGVVEVDEAYQKPTFEQRDHAMSAWKQVLLFRLLHLHLAVMDVAMQSHIGMPAVGSNHAPWRNNLPNEPVKAGSGDVWDGAQTDAADAISILLGDDDDASLQLCFPPYCAGFLSSPVIEHSPK